MHTDKPFDNKKLFKLIDFCTGKQIIRSDKLFSRIVYLFFYCFIFKAQGKLFLLLVLNNDRN